MALEPHVDGTGDEEDDILAAAMQTVSKRGDAMIPVGPDDGGSYPAGPSGQLSPVVADQSATGEGSAAVPWYRGVVEFIVSFAIMAAILLVLRWLVIEPFMIPSGSMLQTIQLGDRIVAEKITTKIDPMPEVGSIMVFKSPRPEGTTLIKRVIAIGGQTIDLRDGVVYIDGVALDEPYVTSATEPMRHASDTLEADITYPYTIPEGYFWVMGDNRSNSADSRVFGPVPVENVIGHAVMRYWPLTSIGLL